MGFNSGFKGLRRMRQVGPVTHTTYFRNTKCWSGNLNLSFKQEFVIDKPWIMLSAVRN